MYTEISGEDSGERVVSRPSIFEQKDINFKCVNLLKPDSLGV